MRMHKKEMILFSLAVLLLLMPSISAEILISQPKIIYNLGDDFEVIITVKPSAPASDFLSASLICGSRHIEIYRSPLSLDQSEERQIKILAKLDNFLIQNAEGECFVKVKFGDEEMVGQKFEITKDVAVTINVQGIIFAPGDLIVITGKTEKANGKILDGFVEASVPELGYSFSSTVNKGVFNISFRIPENAPAGSYDLKVRAYEKDASGKTTNEGSAIALIRIKQVIKEIRVALSDQTTSPKKEFPYSVILYDQAGKQANGEVAVKIYKPEGALFEQKIISAGQLNNVGLVPSSPPGYWKIEAKYENLETSKQFFVEENKDVAFTLMGNNLILENIGNVPFSGPIEVVIGGVSEIKEIKNLPLGGMQKYELKAPKGEYVIEVSEGAEKQTLGTTLLTGRAIGVTAPGERGIVTTSLWVLASLILLMIIALAAVYAYKKLLHRKSKSEEVPVKKTDVINSAGLAQKTKQENQNIIDKGVKQDSAIISLHIKNLSALSNDEALKIIDSALWKAKEAGAKIYADGDYRIAILAPVLTKENENEVKAVQVARQMEKTFAAYNRHSAQKIEFGLGVNSGTLIVEMSQEKFRFMSLNNVVAATKRISELANSETIISESVKNKSLGKIKTIKLADKNLWKVERIIDRSAYSDHINALTRKQI